MGALRFRRQLSRLLHTILLLCLAGVSLGSVPHVSAQAGVPASGGGGRGPKPRLSTSDGYFYSEYVLLKQTVSVWPDGRGDVILERNVRNTDTVDGDRDYWWWNWYPGLFSNIRAWDANGPLEFVTYPSGNEIGVEVIFRTPIHPGETYDFNVGITIGNMTSFNGSDWIAYWYTMPGIPIHEFVQSIDFPANANFVYTDPAPSTRNLNHVEWRYWDRTADWEDVIYVDYTLGSVIHPPVVLVHGFQGLAQWDGNAQTNGYTCSQSIGRYPSETGSTLNSTDGSPALADWLTARGYQVWIAHLQSNPSGTDTLEANAECLKGQLQKVAEQSPGQAITIIAHSMGGLVSRAAVESLPSNVKVKALFTLGSPHAGIPSEAIAGAIPMALFCITQRAACQMTPAYMSFAFNGANPNLGGVNYYFIGGNGGSGFLSTMLTALGQGSNDGLVGQHSAVGWAYNSQAFVPAAWPTKSMPGQYFTNETHSAPGSDDSKSYYVAPSGETSQAFHCIYPLMLNPGDSSGCQDAAAVMAHMPAQDTATLPSSQLSFTEFKTGHLEAAQAGSASLDIDGDAPVSFYLTWSGGAAPSFTLTRPDLVTIDPTYATLHPTEVTYEQAVGSAQVPAYASYAFAAGMTGVWNINVTAPAGGAIDYLAYAAMDSSKVLAAQIDSVAYKSGDTATISASLLNAGVGFSGASVSATVRTADSATEIVPLVDQGNGNYAADYLVPDAPGFLTIDVTASGEDGGTAFTRHQRLFAAIRQDDSGWTGTYSEQARDDNGDGLYERIEFKGDVNVASDGDYAVSADLYAGSTLVGHAADFFGLKVGTQTIQLSFDGLAIRTAGLSGPFKITGLALVPTDTGIPSATATDVLTTLAYSAASFGTQTSHTILGNAGAPGVKLSYTDGSMKTVSADAGGNYTMVVPNNWSGVVTPSAPGYVFVPDHRDYGSMISDETAQDYSAVRPGAGKYDDAHSSWAYAGAWGGVAVPGAFGDTLHIAVTKGGSATFVFNGNRFAMSYLTYAGWGKIGVYLDGSSTPLTTLNTNGPVGLPTYTSPLLAPGIHAVVLKHEGPAGSMIALDSIEVSAPSYVSPGDYDLSDPAWNYTGVWVPVAATGLYGDTLHIGAAPGSTATLSFHGRGFSFTYLRYTGWGTIAVYLDGSPTPYTTISSSGPVGLPTYTSPLLPLGDHTVKLVHAGPAGKFIALDYVTIAP